MISIFEFESDPDFDDDDNITALYHFRALFNAIINKFYDILKKNSTKQKYQLLTLVNDDDDGRLFNNNMVIFIFEQFILTVWAIFDKNFQS